MLDLEMDVKPSFGGHEKFVFRDGWLKKGIDAVGSNDQIFTEDDALVILGVGKNMVRSIRHWCLATRIVDEIKSTDRKKSLRLTPLGHQLMGDGGWDPFLEDIGSLWLLHWQLASNQSRSLIWYLSFSRFYDMEFSKKSLIAFVERQLQRMEISTTAGMIEREVDCFLRTYTASTRGNRVSEENLDCPLTELDLIRAIPHDNLYRFNIGPKPSLAHEIFGYGLLHFLAAKAQHRRTVAVDECIYHEASPGQIFRLDENSVVEYLEAMADLSTGKILLQETAGLQQLYINTTEPDFFAQTAEMLLESYYGQR